jgi:hypothetical protein
MSVSIDIADTPSSLASSLTQLNRVDLRRIGWLSGRPRGQASYKWGSVDLKEIGRLSGRQDQKIAAFGSSYVGLCTLAID